MIRAVILDLDGTVYRGREEVPGASAFIRFLSDHAIRYLFVTNRSNRTPAAVAEHLRDYAIACTENEVLTSSQATAAALEPGPAYWIGEEGLRIELERTGFTWSDSAPRYVIVSFDRRFTYEKMKTASRLIMNGARFVTTNPDTSLKSEHGLNPGTGAITASIAATTGLTPLVIGKPSRHILDMALRRLALPADDVINVGDNLETDVRAGINAGIRTALILTGVSSRADLSAGALRPAWVVEDYIDLAAIVRKENGLQAVIP